MLKEFIKLGHLVEHDHSRSAKLAQAKKTAWYEWAICISADIHGDSPDTSSPIMKSLWMAKKC